jgi:membrane protein implicated in regulation of membrane protease activity
MSGWIWLMAGIGFALLELLTPCGFFLLILGLASCLVAAAVGLGLNLTLTTQVILFSVLAVVIWVTLGRYIRFKVGVSNPNPEQVVGNAIVLAADMAPGEIGAGELWGSVWRVENVDNEPLKAKSNAVVVGVNGVTLQVKKRNS